MAAVRNKKINNAADEVKLACSFSIVDVKDLLKMYADILAKNGIKDSPDDERSVRHWLEHDGRAFLSWPQKWREQLSGWFLLQQLEISCLCRQRPTKTNIIFLIVCL